MIHQLAYIHPDAKIGKDVTIDPFASISGDVVIGEGTWVGSNAVIMDGARIGENCKIYPGAVISAVSQDLKYKGEYTTTEIGNNTTIREFVTVHKGTTDRHKTIVGSNCLLMAYVHVAHDCIIGNNVIIANSTQLAGHITIDDWVIIEGMVGTQQFVHIGAHAFVAGGSLVRKNVPPFVKAAREPLAFVGINSVGMRRRGFTNEKIHEIQEIYRILFQQNNNTTQALLKIEAEMSVSDERDEIISFIQNSVRGIMKGYKIS